MRNTFISTLGELAARNPDIVLLTGDLGFKVFDVYRAARPAQFINAGVAESNMIGVAAGLSFEGKVPFAYSIVPFLTMRPFEQIRNDVCFHNANVKLVGVGGGFSYGPNGTSHHALTDVALMRLLPEMTVLAPGDPWEAAFAVEAAAAHKGPVYIRLGRAYDEPVHTGPLQCRLGQAIVLREGRDVGIIASGLMLSTAVEVARRLEADGVSVYLVSMPTIKPLDEAAVAAVTARCRAVFTVEEHSIVGGLGSAVLECLNSRGLPVEKLRCIAVPDATVHTIGSQDYLRRCAGLAPEQIVARIHVCLKGKDKQPC